MNKVQLIIKVSKSIMDQSFEYAKKEIIDDVDLIKEIKRIILGSVYFCEKEKQTEEELILVDDELKLYAQEKYLKEWESSITEDEKNSFDAIMKEGLDTYKYLFEYEQHKRWHLT